MTVMLTIGDEFETNSNSKSHDKFDIGEKENSDYYEMTYVERK